jgi:UDP-N-acetylmuramyl tripeptide synthase
MATRVVNAVSRVLHVGSGTVIGGRAGLALDPGLLERLAAGRSVSLVSGTNGKTTTTRLLAVALERGQGGAGVPASVGARGRVPGRGRRRGLVVTNATGANMPPGHVAALAGGPAAVPVVLEVDEGYLPGLVRVLSPRVVVLLNLSRDQLDRTNELRMLAGRWREALGAAAGTTVVANADDPLVAWGAGTAGHVVWVAAGLGWRLDAVGCPACEGRITFDDQGWSCTCGFARPDPGVQVVDGPDSGTDSVWPGGRRLPVVLGIPGRFNLTNAVMAAAAAEALGVPAERALEAMASVGEVEGRFTTRRIGGVPTRLMLAKNPAGWHELLGLVCSGSGPVVVGINARVADGRDPSWLWDVPFERLGGRPVVATGARCLDLSVRLKYAEVPHRTVRDPVAAVRAAGVDPGGVLVEFIGNYTAFHDLLARR